MSDRHRGRSRPFVIFSVSEASRARAISALLLVGCVVKSNRAVVVIVWSDPQLLTLEQKEKNLASPVFYSNARTQ